MPHWDDILKGTNGNDILSGGSGDDFLQGRAGNEKAQAAGLSQDQIDQLSESLSGSSNANEALAGVPERTRDAIVAAYQQVQATGTAGAVMVAAAIAALSALVVWWLWPRSRVGRRELSDARANRE